jgi:predicted RNA binding protein YcfA (HicA-like mRNA interferase family)
MPSSVRNWTASEVIKFLKNHGFILHRSNGSHFQYKKVTPQETRLVTVAYHGKEAIPIGTINSIIRQSGIDKKNWVKP